MNVADAPHGSPSLIAIGRLVSMAMALLMTPVVARAIGPEGRGTSATMVAIVTITTVALGLGVPLVLRRRVGEGESARQVVSAGRLFAGMTVFPSVGIGLICNLLMFAGEPIEDQVAFIVAMALIPLSISWAQDVSVLVATREFRRMAVLGVIQAGAALAITVALWLMGGLTVAGVVYATTAGNVMTCVVAFFWVRAGVGGFRLATRIMREGLTLFGGQLADVGTKRLDQVLAFPILGAVGAGFYSVASLVSTLSMPVAQAASAAMFKSMVGANGGTPESARLILRRGVVLGVLATIPIAAACAIGIPIVFGEEFVPAVAPALILALGAPAAVGAYCGSTWFAAQHRGGRMTLIQVVTLAVMVAAFVLLGMMWSLIGAAIGVTFSLYLCLALLSRSAAGGYFSAIPHLSDIRPALRLLWQGR